MLKKSQLKGKFGEYFACFLLILKGYKPLSMNDKRGGIEGDIIASKGENIILVEVKFRKSRLKAHYAIHPEQQKRLVRKLQQLSCQHPHKNLRIDLMLIYPSPPYIEHLENVFSL